MFSANVGMFRALWARFIPTFEKGLEVGQRIVAPASTGSTVPVT